MGEVKAAGGMTIAQSEIPAWFRHAQSCHRPGLRSARGGFGRIANTLQAQCAIDRKKETHWTQALAAKR